MTQDIATLDAPEVGRRQVDTRRGSANTEVSSQWARRPADEKFLTLDSLAEHVLTRRERSAQTVVDLPKLQFDGDSERDEIVVDTDYGPATFTNWSFGQMCSTVGYSAQELRKLPVYLAAAVVQTMAMQTGGQAMEYVENLGSGGLMRALTGPAYGRIYDADVVQNVQRIAKSGAWKVPGCLNWADGSYDPHTPVTKDTTTLFASDRDVFMFLCDDTHPIEVGKLRNGDPDLMFRGFIVSNSETGAGKFRLATMYLRGVCCNRILWGVEGFKEIEIRHNNAAPERFVDEIMPSLDSYASLDASRLSRGVAAAKGLIAARTEDKQVEFLVDLGFSQKVAKDIILTGEKQEGARPSSVWEFAQAITAHAQALNHHQDDRFAMEAVAGKLLDDVKID
ncbi:MAG: hypothetical protein RJA36_1421 [Pseudomonadota bacterium]|jgi:hypothetical protein